MDYIFKFLVLLLARTFAVAYIYMGLRGIDEHE